MIGLGTLINVGLIIAGGIVGLASGSLITERIREGVLKATAVCILFLGLGGALEQMLRVEGAGIASGGTMRIFISLAAGALIGEVVGIETGIERLGAWLRRVSGSSGDNAFVEAFVSTSLSVCIGAMAVVGSVQDGVFGNWGTLALKGSLDAIVVCIMAASLGRGAIFSAVPVALFQGSITLAARALQPLLTEGAVDAISMVGSIMIFCVGVNLIWPKTFRVANMLPALVIAAALSYF
ncbi:DUF554 domain-containing protein [Collinsella vaginalis]|uniref:DUF554 domain-containing protein n=1 Tax=Collinsella vaginalis TaxID=1870987 RepID=UPI000A269D7B|nr:DUF554 domain-containing protein [Collinsella vaginalis]